MEDEKIKKNLGNRIEWEVFADMSYYDMWAVRPVGDTDMNSPRLFHFVFEKDAREFAALAEIADVAFKIELRNEN